MSSTKWNHIWRSSLILSPRILKWFSAVVPILVDEISEIKEAESSVMLMVHGNHGSIACGSSSKES